LISGVLLAVAVLAGLVFLSVVAGAVSLVLWVVLLPFRLLGLVFKGLAALLLLPVLLLCGLGLGALIGIPLLFALAIPLLPVALLIGGIVWLARRGVHSAVRMP